MNKEIVEKEKDKKDETPIVEKEEKEQPKEQSNREKLKALVTELLGTEEVQDDEELDAKLHDLLIDLNDYRTSSQENNETLMSLFQAEPTLGKILSDMRDGATLSIAIGRHLDPESIVPQEGDPDYEAWAKEKDERINRLNARKESQENYEKNLIASEQIIREFVEESGFDEEQTAEFMSFLDAFTSDLLDGKVSKDTLVKLSKVLTADAEKEEAVKLAEVRGKNQAIEAEKKKPQDGDGLPDLSSGGGAATEEPQQKDDYIGNLVAIQKKRNRL